MILIMNKNNDLTDAEIEKCSRVVICAGEKMLCGYDTTLL